MVHLPELIRVESLMQAFGTNGTVHHVGLVRRRFGVSEEVLNLLMDFWTFRRDVGFIDGILDFSMKIWTFRWNV